MFAGHWPTTIVKKARRVGCFLITPWRSGTDSLAFRLWKSLSDLSVKKIAFGDVSGCDPAGAWPCALRDSGEPEKQRFAPLCKVSPDWDVNVLRRSFGDQKLGCFASACYHINCFFHAGVRLSHIYSGEKNVETGRLIMYISTHAFSLEPSRKQHFILVWHVETSIYLRKCFIEYKWR